MTTLGVPTYDSAAPRRPLATEIANLWRHRGLLRLLVSRDLTVRYKRSALGVWWTLLNPLLTMLVLAAVFSNLLSERLGGTSPIVYVLSGILIATFFAQGVQAVGSSIVNSAAVLKKVYVPHEVFAVSAAMAGAMNFLLGLIPLLAVQLLTGTGIPWTVVLVPIVVFAMLALVAGLGLMVASLAVYFYDVLDLSAVMIQLVSYLAPTFYPIEMVPERFLFLVKANPLFSYLRVFRGFIYEGQFAPAWNFVMMGATSVLVLMLGVWVFHRSWRNLAVVI